MWCAVDENLKIYDIDADTNSTVREVNAGSATEFIGMDYQTGWIPIGDLERQGIIRRINLRYYSVGTFNIFIYVDGDASTAVDWPDGTHFKSFPADTSGTDWRRSKPSIRCRYFMIRIQKGASPNTPLEIRKLEVEFE